MEHCSSNSFLIWNLSGTFLSEFRLRNEISPMVNKLISQREFFKYFEASKNVTLHQMRALGKAPRSTLRNELLWTCSENIAWKKRNASS